MAPSTPISSFPTPGVYVTEPQSFPTSIIGVATAIPAFIGYTQTARSNDIDDTRKPRLIRSMAEFVAAFGGPPTEDAGGNPLPLFTLTAVHAATDLADFVGVDHTRYALSLDASKPFGCLYYALQLFFATGGDSCYIVSAGAYPVAARVGDLIDALGAVAGEVGPTMLVVPDGMLCAPRTLAESACSSDAMLRLSQAMLQQCADRQYRIALLDALQLYPLSNANALATDFDAALLAVRTDITAADLSYGACYAPYLRTSIVSPAELTFAHFDLAVLHPLLKIEAAALFPSTAGGGQQDPRLVKLNYLLDSMAGTARATDQGASVKALNQALTASLPLLQQIYAIAAARLNLLPASAAMAGVITAVDQMRGVWNAPANVGLANMEPSFQLTTDQQQSLNLPIDGKAINPIRTLDGLGTVVWGARTLDGNSQDLRYVQVRRTLIYVEQSIKTALTAFVFAVNTAQTWSNVTSLISNFLMQLWSQGGLMGASPKDAFIVQCGLGSTMTAADVLDGSMIVQVKLQLVQPEFIELTFRQTMQRGN